MKLNDILLERLSSVLYHATSFESALAILESDSLTSPNKEVSFARSLTGSYPKDNKMIGIIFKFDGDKLNQKYRGKAVGSEHFGLDDDPEYQGRDNGQLEDRLYYKGDAISNVTQYIDSAIVFIPEDYLDDGYSDELDGNYDDNLMVLDKVMDQLDSHDISYRVVTNERDLYNSKVDDRKGLSKLLTKRFKDDDISDDYAKKFDMDRRNDYEVEVMFGFNQKEYEIDYGEDAMEYADPVTFDPYYKHRYHTEIKANSREEAEQLITAKLRKRFSEEELNDLEIYADET